MRYGVDDTFWVVLDPTPASEMADILFETTLCGLERQFKGGLTADRNLTIFSDATEANVEAFGRLVAMRAYEAIAHRAAGRSLMEASRVEVLDEAGNVLFEADLIEDAE